MEHLHLLRWVVRSIKPKTADIYCTVPGCSRSWYLSGSKSGFILAAAQNHSHAHWERYHKEQSHPEATWTDSTGHTRPDSTDFCNFCTNLSIKGK